MHDATKVLLGATGSNHKDVTRVDSSPVTFPAGTCVRLTANGLSVTKADGSLMGASLGKGLSNDLKSTAVLRAGEAVPVLLTDDEDDYSYVEVGEYMYVDDVTGLANIPDDGDVTTTVSNAVYVSGPLDGVAEDGSIVKVALVDMVGGL